MVAKPKILFWLNGFFLHYSLAYYLQSKLHADFFGIVDINSKPKKFFQEQTLVNFKKIWFYHDHIKKNQQKPNLDYLMHFEKKYGINLWKLALNERFFYLHNRFYKFKKQEILSILEQEIRLFEDIISEINPDYLLTYDPVFHHQKLLLDLCKAKGIHILSTIIASGIENKTIIVEDGATYDLDPHITADSLNDSNSKVDTSDSYDGVIKNYLKKRNATIMDKLTALIKYTSNFDSELVESNFMYYGKNRFKVIKDAFSIELKRIRNYRFLQTVSTSSPELNAPYVYFPMSIDEEMNLLHYAPYYTNQIEVIRHVAKSIPVDYSLYVKEHIAARLRGWHDSNYYKQIIELPNVTFVNPQYDNNTLIKNSQLVVTIRGYSSLKAIRYGKPAVVFGEQPLRIMPSIFTVGSLNDLPELIKMALKHKVNPSDYQKYINLLNSRLFEFNMFEYENRRDSAFFAGSILSNVSVSEKDMIEFLDKNKDMFSHLIDAHLKIIHDTTKPLK
ncbi:MAG: hypothetical protein QXN55_05515 [Candidatus Nitrosotenuis sp.]